LLRFSGGGLKAQWAQTQVPFQDGAASRVLRKTFFGDTFISGKDAFLFRKFQGIFL